MAGACACQKSRRQKIDGCQKQTAVQENFLVSLSRNVLLLEEGLIRKPALKENQSITVMTLKPNTCDDADTRYMRVNPIS